MVGDAIIF